MMPVAVGNVVVASAGTPVAMAPSSIPCCRIRVQMLAGNTGEILVGLPGMVATSGYGVLHELVVGAATDPLDVFEIESPDGSNCLDPSVYMLDAAENGEGARVSCWVR